MSFYGNIVNYFSAAFKKFKYAKIFYSKGKKTDDSPGLEEEIKENYPVEAALSQDELIFDSKSENFIEYHYNEYAEADRIVKTMDMQLNVEALREDSTVDIVPQGEDGYPNSYKIYQDNGNEGEHLERGEIKYYAKYNSNNGNLYIPFIYFKEETE